MSNINLSSVNETPGKKSLFSGGAVMGIAGVLALVVALWGFLFFYKEYYLKKSIEKTKSDYAEYLKKMESPEIKKVIDFQRRLEVSKEAMTKGRNIKSDLTQIEGLIVPGVYLNSYSYNDVENKIILGCSGDNFNTAAKQILSFKSSGLFSQVISGKTSMEPQSNRIIFPIELKTK